MIDVVLEVEAETVPDVELLSEELIVALILTLALVVLLVDSEALSVPVVVALVVPLVLIEKLSLDVRLSVDEGLGVDVVDAVTEIEEVYEAVVVELTLNVAETELLDRIQQFESPQEPAPQHLLIFPAPHPQKLPGQ